ncbi:MAG: hypothetical protein PHN34_13150 [Kiritimatiellae bacterium]|nr:hypothetical protein [Kiritimatiellia bacterium]
MKPGEHPEIRWSKTNKTTNGFQRTRQQAPSRRRARVFRALGGVIFGGHPKTPYPFDRTLAFSLNWHCRTHPDTF